jgi:hypothetical protein
MGIQYDRNDKVNLLKPIKDSCGESLRHAEKDRCLWCDGSGYIPIDITSVAKCGCCNGA